jgi:glucan phosphoethanolaminetransferase (alkaline phosphatase superfamily)
MNIKEIPKKIISNQIIFYFALSLLTFFEVEVLNSDATFFKVKVSNSDATFFEIKHRLIYILLDLIVYFSIYFLLGLFSKKILKNSLITLIIINIFAWINNVVSQFRGLAFRFTDILSVRTAANVAGMYSFKLNIFHIIWLVLFITSFLMIFIWSKHLNAISESFRLKKKLIFTAICVFFIVYIPFETYHFMGLNNFDGCYVGGYNLYLLHSAIPNTIKKPSGYNKTDYKELTKVECNSEKRPNIIVIMNESFCDLNRIVDIQTSEDVLPFFNKFIKEENIIEGNAYVSVFGGNTANSEMEFLTGSVMGFWGEQNLCYSMGYSKYMDILPNWLEKIGYETYAMHPATGNNYGRRGVYKYMKFNNLWFIDDFLDKGAKTTHFDNATYFLKEIISDSENYRIINEEIERNDKPVFMFNTTIQNHGGYSWRGYDDIKLLNKIDDKDLNVETNEYLTLIRQSDQALEELITSLKNSDEDTIVLFFGDHQPALSLSLARRCGKEPKRKEIFNTPFFIWANFDIGEMHDVDTSLNYLPNILLQQSGIGLLNQYQNNIEKIREKYPVLSVNNTVDSSGKTVDFNKVFKSDNLLKDYHKQSYNVIYDAD